MTLKTGDKAPSFKLYSSDKKEVSLEDFQGHNLVVLFFPLAFTSVCTAELCAMRDNIGDYESLDTQVVAISVDSPQTLNKFKIDQGFNFTLLSDFNKEISRAYGALYEEFAMGMRGVSKRAAFVIDEEGVVRYAEVLESAGNLPNFEAVKGTLAALK